MQATRRGFSEQFECLTIMLHELSNIFKKRAGVLWILAEVMKIHATRPMSGTMEVSNRMSLKVYHKMKWILHKPIECRWEGIRWVLLPFAAFSLLYVTSWNGDSFPGKVTSRIPAKKHWSLEGSGYSATYLFPAMLFYMNGVDTDVCLFSKFVRGVLRHPVYVRLRMFLKCAT